jgi:hypothetical protein
MAHDLLFKKSRRNWSRDSVSGHNGAYPAMPSTLVVQERRGPGILGWSLGIMIGSRLVTGKWPWYWFSRIDHRLG